MREHFAHFPDFLYRVLHKLDLYVGVGAGIFFLIIAFLLSVGEETIVAVTVAIAAISLFFSSYGVYREERQKRAERERTVKVTAKAGSWAFNGKSELQQSTGGRFAPLSLSRSRMMRTSNT